VFYPFHNKKVREFEYDERLRLFALSLSWRTLKANCGDEFKAAVPELVSQVEQAEIDWRKILLQGRFDGSPYETHFFFWIMSRKVKASLLDCNDTCSEPWMPV